MLGDLVRGRGRLVAVLVVVALIGVLVGAKMWGSDASKGCTQDASGAAFSAHDQELTANPIVQRVAQGVSYDDAKRFLGHGDIEVPSQAEAARVAKNLDKNGHCLNA